MKALLTQSYEIFNIYGKEPEAVLSAMRAFAMVLEPYHMDDITEGFKQWMRESSTFPTPADILRLTQEFIAHRRPLKSAPAREAEPLPVNCVPWAFKTYQQIIDAGLMPQLLQYLRHGLSREKAEEYIKYLRSLCDFPSDFVPKHGVSFGN